MTVKKIFLLFLLIYVSGTICAAGKQEADNARIQDIFRLWTDIEDSLTLENISSFNKALNAYLDSERYRIFRLVPISSKLNFGPALPNEMPEIEEAALLALSLYDAASCGDYEKTAGLSERIYRNLALSLSRDTEIEQFAVGAYIRLFIILIVFIMLSIILILSLNNDLKLSRRREEETTGFSRAVLLAHEAERARLSRELHDTVIQDLRYLSLESGRIGRTSEPQERAKLCAEAALMQTELIAKVRNICEYLIPPDFRFQGLGDALRNLCFYFEKRTGMECRIIIEGDVPVTAALGEEKQLQIFRIVQEALSNVEKHSCAPEAIVVLREDAAGCIFISVTDDGKGFNPESKAGKGQLGIRGMHERAALLGGNLKIISEPGQGTTVRLSLPADTRG